MEKRLFVGIGIFGLISIAVLALRGYEEVPIPPGHDTQFVHNVDGRMMLDGARFRFIGVNVYSLLSAKNHESGFVCGRAHSSEERESVMREVHAFGGNVIRVPVYQPYTDSGTDFTELDETLALARELGIRLILVIEGQWGHCSTGSYMTPTWYRGGYRSPYGGHPLSYLDYTKILAERYKNEPAILAWQLMNEAESSAGAVVVGIPDPEALYAFAHDMSAEIRAIDRNHLISLGTIDDSRAGMSTVDYANILQLSTVDIAEGHDYDAIQPYPMAMRRCQKIAELTKVPFFIGEVGVSVNGRSKDERARLLMRKLEAAWNADVDGILIWSYRAGDGGGFDIWPDDPIVPQLREFTEKRLPARSE